MAKSVRWRVIFSPKDDGNETMFDWTISLGNVINVLIVAGGGVLFVYSIRWKVDDLARDILEMQTQLKRMVDVLVEQGRHAERLAAMDSRIAAQGTRLDELTNRFNRDHNGLGMRK
jgi:hypothetical protein